MPATLDQEATTRARAAIIQVLEERPHLRDTRNNQVQDLIPFLEIEEDSEEWLPPFLSNTRTLANLWRSLAKESEAAPIETPPSSPKSTRRNTNGHSRPANVTEKPVRLENQPATSYPSSPKPETGDIWATAQTAEAAKDESPKPAAFEAPVKNQAASPEVLTSETKSSAEVAATRRPAPEVLTGEIVEETLSEPAAGYELVKSKNELTNLASPQPAERALQASRAVAEQFTIVQYHEQMLEQVSRSVEELTEALAQARQRQADATHAYTSSLEELARLMATSLGPRAGEFGKLFSRVVSTGGGAATGGSPPSKGR